MRTQASTTHAMRGQVGGPPPTRPISACRRVVLLALAAVDELDIPPRELLLDDFHNVGRPVDRGGDVCDRFFEAELVATSLEALGLHFRRQIAEGRHR